MPSLRDQFQHFYMPDEDAVKTAVQTGLIAPDTNVLLGLYRFQAGARDQLFDALGLAGDRLWVPHQVGLEFHRRRLGVIHDQENYFKATEKALRELVQRLRDAVEAFGKEIRLGKDEIRKNLDGIVSLQELLIGEVVKAKKATEVRLKDHKSDAVLERLEHLLDGRVGGPMEPEELEEARKEAKRRVEEKIPPGYEDAGKADPTGDYLIFRQLMTEAGQRKLPVVVTDDTKRDWYRREHGLPLGPLGAAPELREDMMSKAGVSFMTLTTEEFLGQAETYLGAEVSEDTFAQARELPGRLATGADEWLRSPALSRMEGQLMAKIPEGLLDREGLLDGVPRREGQSYRIGDRARVHSPDGRCG